MKFTEYLKDKVLILLLNIVCMAGLTAFLRLTGYSMDYCVIIILCWGMIFVVWFLTQFFSRRKYFEKLEQITENLDERYLLGELMPDSFHLEDQKYRNLIRKSNKSVIERIHKIEQEQKEYREYIESWVHEIKAPITAIALNCENNRDERSRYILVENRKVENYVDMALYYARMDAVYKDYMIAETNLQEIAQQVLLQNKYYLIQSHVQAEVDCPDIVYSDKKWIAFILNQLIQNSVKYSKADGAYINISTHKNKNGVILQIKDDGIGIHKEELSRIFEKGFTGTNGRNRERSTGMGLYLCRRLCDKLNISIDAESEPENGTNIMITFPMSDYISGYREV